MKPTLDEISAGVIAAFPKLSAPEQRASLAAYRLLAKGRPIIAEQISAACGVAQDAVTEMLGRWHGVERERDGAVVGFWGLTLSATRHRFRIEGRELHTWCGWDTLFLPPLLGVPAEVESRCPVSGQRIDLRVGPAGVETVRPEAVVLSFLVPRESEIERSVIESFCCHVHFFASRQDADQWVSRRPETFVLSVEEAWQVGIRRNAAQFGQLATRELNASRAAS